MVWNNNLKLWNIIKGEKMVKAELIENPTESEIVKVDTVPDVDVAIEQWDAYQRLCKGLLNEMLQLSNGTHIRDYAKDY